MWVSGWVWLFVSVGLCGFEYLCAFVSEKQ